MSKNDNDRLLRWSGYMVAVEMEFEKLLNERFPARCPTVTESVETHRQAFKNVMAKLVDVLTR